jgi:hypothetical protein
MASSSLKNLSIRAIMKGATRQNVKNIMKVPALVMAIGPNKREQLQALRRLLKFLDLYVEYSKAHHTRTLVQKLPNGVKSSLSLSKANANARRMRINAATRNVQRIRNKGTALRNKLGLHVYRNTEPFNESTVKNALGRIAVLRQNGTNNRSIFNAYQALQTR